MTTTLNTRLVNGYTVIESDDGRLAGMIDYSVSSRRFVAVTGTGTHEFRKLEAAQYWVLAMWIERVAEEAEQAAHVEEAHAITF